ncbi:MAG: hypothetical protein U9N61_11535 [Euryarchaeota archaeon]|nr:hypothetical protein [Euryarchaeota archaeon]
MAALQYGLRSVEQSECRWRTTINYNIENTYTSTEMGTVKTGKSAAVHEHPGYFPLPTAVSSTDVDPVFSGLTSDVAFSSMHGPCLVDRTTSELFRISVDNGSIIVTGTGEFV